MSAIFFSLSMQTHSQHYSISSCAYSGVHNSRKRLLSRSLENSLSMQILHMFMILCTHVAMAQCSFMVCLKWRYINLTIFFFFQRLQNKVSAKYKCFLTVLFKFQSQWPSPQVSRAFILWKLIIIHPLLKY